MRSSAAGCATQKMRSRSMCGISGSDLLSKRYVVSPHKCLSSWNMRSAIPEAVLTALSVKWPTARLHVTTPFQAPGWNAGEVRSLVEQCARVERLALKIETEEEENKAGYESYRIPKYWPDLTIDHILQLRRLRTLELELEFGIQNREFIHVRLPNGYLIEEAGECRATALYRQFLDKNTRLEMLTMRFILTRPRNFVTTPGPGYEKDFVVERRIVGTEDPPEEFF
ncbi:hypothetical protein BU26DRAFT_44872 [Trematosphaeria pertusa]|uniref:Uncharacterized protein n=1 Tax=Trematosphaeria pertusa TaxID=390896 RepID=A0A6A6IA44_9PLEO|nr:uncharacterized protein BU26DRAFT_44872 [Trematosphaeria pertusa]KAF2246400.1 hypothetical protein BU26DRAFT_44872 [Trematosphaeria pertusa]